jgi:hypothetical protein
MSKLSRREFLHASAAGAGAMALPALAPAASRSPGTAKSCIFINMVGGPAHLDTFDPKPDAPSQYRGPFQPIRTKVPGIHLSELFPNLAKLTDKFALIRSMHHTAPPIHEAGFQLLNTGRLFRDGPEWPSVGTIVSRLTGKTSGILATDCEIHTGISVAHGQSGGWLNGNLVYGLVVDPEASVAGLMSEAVSFVQFGWDFITVNTYHTVFDSPSWDCHADGGSLCTNLADIRDTVAPSFDTAFAQLLSDLDERGLLDSTLVVATGEFGRTPLLNANGGRDHWAGAWTALVAGGGVKGGQVIGRTDAKGLEPANCPVTPQELVATIFHALGIPADATIPGPDGPPVAVYPGSPVLELF